MLADDKKSDFKSKFVERMYNPLQLRIMIAVSVLAAGYLGIYMPLDSTISETNGKLAKEQRRLGLARDIEHLRAQVATFKDRLPEQRDPNEWVEYVLAGIRDYPLKLVSLDAKPPLDVGPYKAVVLKIELEGAFRDMESLMRWLESNEKRLFRIDAVKISPHRSGNGTLIMQLTVLGVMG